MMSADRIAPTGAMAQRAIAAANGIPTSAAKTKPVSAREMGAW